MKRNSFATANPTQAAGARFPENTWPAHLHLSADGVCDDHFIEKDGVRFAGKHLILDLWGARPLDDLHLMEATLRECVRQCRATLLHIHLHHFLPNGGISGVAVLAESHISVHTWPERDFAAFDIFMCGDARPEAAIDILERAFCPATMTISENLRGLATDA